MEELKKVFNKLDNTQQQCIDLYKIIFNLRAHQVIGEELEEKYVGLVDIYEKIFYGEIREILKHDNIRDVEITDNEQIIIMYNYLIKRIWANLENMIVSIDQFSLQYCLYSIASYQAEFHTRFTNILNGSYSIEECMGVTELEQTLIRFLQDNKSQMIDYNTLIATDKATIQYILNRANRITPLESHLSDFHAQDFIKIYFLGMVIVQLISEREFITSKFTTDNKIVIKDYILQNIYKDGGFIEKIKERCVYDFSETLSFYSDDIMDKLDKGLERELGFRLKTIEKFLEQKNKYIPDLTITTVVDRTFLVAALVNDTGCRHNEAENIITYLESVEEGIEDDIYSSTEKLNSRVFKKCFYGIKFKEYRLILFSYPLLTFAYEILRRELIYNLIPECKHTNSKIIEKNCKNQFVINVAQKLQNFVDVNSDKMIINAHHIQHNNKDMVLRNEIDILAAIDDKLFVIECKDVYYSFSPFAFRQDIGKTIKFINKMQVKVEDVNQKIEFLKDRFDTDIKTIIPIIVFKTYNVSIDAQYDKKGIYITCSKKLDNMIRSFFE